MKLQIIYLSRPLFFSHSYFSDLVYNIRKNKYTKKSEYINSYNGWMNNVGDFIIPLQV